MFTGEAPAPCFVDDIATTGLDQPVTVNVLANDTSGGSPLAAGTLTVQQTTSGSAGASAYR